MHRPLCHHRYQTRWSLLHHSVDYLSAGHQTVSQVLPREVHLVVRENQSAVFAQHSQVRDSSIHASHQRDPENQVIQSTFATRESTELHFEVLYGALRGNSDNVEQQ